ncbi:MAG TPA: anti sigma factor C-terminal domain-containing protein [Bacilli bacterium]|nr:anti sigma factor C-terminal domain-containing protein [Bacilli bacterium]
MKDGHRPMNDGHELDQRLLRYLRGELNEEEKERLQRQLTEHSTYQQRLEELMLLDEEAFPLPLPQAGKTHDPANKTLPSLTAQQQMRIFRRGKWRSRIINTVFTAGAVGGACILLMVTNSLFSVWYQGPTEGDLFRTTRDMIEFTKPGVTIGSSTTSGVGWTVETKYELRDQVGREQAGIGYFQHNLFFTSLSSRETWSENFFKKRLYFHYPVADLDDRGVIEQQNHAGWHTLEQLPEGTVAQLAISFDHLLTLDDYAKLADKYDLATTWYAVDTGLEAPYLTDEAGMHQSALLGEGEVWGFPASQIGYIDESGDGRATGDSTDLQTKGFLQEMQYLADSKRLAEEMEPQLYWLRNMPHLSHNTLADRLDYLQQNGVHLYGALVTGPTKELLKLRDEPSVLTPFVGKVDWWNWDQPVRNGEVSLY